MPEIYIYSGHGLAGRGIDELDVQGHWNTLLIFNEVLADHLTVDEIWTLRDFGLEYARGIIGEE